MQTMLLTLILAGAAGAAPAPDFDAWWNYHEPGATEKKFRARLAELDDSDGSDYRLQLLTQIARTQGLQDDFDGARATLAEVEKAMEDLPTVRVRYLLELGRVHRSSGDGKGSIPFFEQALEVSEEHGLDFHAVDAAHMLGIAAEGKKAQVAWNEKAMDLAEASQDPRARKWLGSLYNNLGWTYHDAGEFPRAQELFEKALAFREEQGKVGPIRVARWSVARGLRSLGKLEEALRIQEDLLEEYEKAGETDGFVHEELGELYLELRGLAAARPQFARAHELLKKESWLEKKRVERLRLLGSGKS